MTNLNSATAAMDQQRARERNIIRGITVLVAALVVVCWCIWESTKLLDWPLAWMMLGAAYGVGYTTHMWIEYAQTWVIPAIGEKIL